ncbi:MAG: Gfo/Idh/MocA family oxidoreductase [Flavipsychrobacter sp.]
MDRKDFVTLSAKAALSLGVALKTSFYNEDDAQQENLLDKKGTGSVFELTTAPIDTVRIGMIGVGNRGGVLLQMFEYLLKEKNAAIVAIADIQEEKANAAQEILNRLQKKPAKLYYGGEEEWKKVAERDDIDLLVIATPWHLHTPMCIYGMEQGKHVACEVPIATTLKDCWTLVEVAERTQKHCMMLENCCFNGEELWVLNMIQEGVFGDITHAEGAYLHDLRKHLIDEKNYYNQWRIKEHEKHNGNLYPTHGLGPIASYMDIGRGDNLDTIVSMSSREKNLSDTAKRKNSSHDKIKCGDLNTSLIKTKRGKTIMLQFDVHTGRPYSRLNNVTGTMAVHEGYPSRLYIDDGEPKYYGHEWLEEKEYREYRVKYDHPLWGTAFKNLIDIQGGHGGMDAVMMYRLVKALNQGLPLDINVYDSVLWSAIVPLSEMSVAQGSMPIKIPDFTGGLWENYKPSPLLRNII